MLVAMSVLKESFARSTLLSSQSLVLSSDVVLMPVAREWTASGLLISLLYTLV